MTTAPAAPPASRAPHPSGERSDPLLGAVLEGTWRVTRRVGTGGMGRVYEAEHVRLERRFALKVVHERHAAPHGRGARDAIARFEREARASARIRSDHVVDVVDTFVTPDGRPCLVAELLDGEDLHTRLERVGTLSPGVAVELARQLCRGLAAAHAHGVVHRDLKPSNLFLTAGADGRITLKILDFGVAKLVGDPSITRAGAVVGTPSYMPPEQARGEHGFDPRVDVYGAGAVLYRMLVGRAPHDGPDATQILKLATEEPVTPPRALRPDLPPELDRVVMAALAPDPRDRPPDALALEAALAAVADLADEAAPDGGPAWRGAGAPEGSTLVLPRGSVGHARVRSTHLLLGDLGTGPSLALAGLAAGATVGAGMAAALRSLGESTPFGATPTVLTVAAGVVAAALTAGELFRARRPLRPAGARRLARRARLATLAGAVTLGVARTAAVLIDALGGPSPLGEPAGDTAAVAGALVVALMAFGAADRAPAPGPEHAPTLADSHADTPDAAGEAPANDATV